MHVDREAPQHTPAWHLPWVILEPCLLEVSREWWCAWGHKHGGCHVGWHRSPRCLGPGCCICKPLLVVWGSSLWVAPEASPSTGLGVRVAPRKGGLAPLTSPMWDWPCGEAAAEHLTACLDRKQGAKCLAKGTASPACANPHEKGCWGAACPKSSTSSLAIPPPWEAPAAGSTRLCAPPRQPLAAALGCTPSPRPEDVSHMFGTMSRTKLLVLPPLGMVQAAQSCASGMGKIYSPCPNNLLSGQAHGCCWKRPSKLLPRWAGKPTRR